MIAWLKAWGDSQGLPLQPPGIDENSRVAERFAWELDDATLFASVPEECLAVYMLYLGHWPYAEPLFELPPDKMARIIRVLSATIPKRDKNLEAILKAAMEMKARAH